MAIEPLVEPIPPGFVNGPLIQTRSDGLIVFYVVENRTPTASLVLSQQDAAIYAALFLQAASNAQERKLPAPAPAGQRQYPQVQPTMAALAPHQAPGFASIVFGFGETELRLPLNIGDMGKLAEAMLALGKAPDQA